MKHLQTVRFEIAVSVDADLAALLVGREARGGQDPSGSMDYPRSGLEIAAEDVADALLDAASQMLHGIGAQRLSARATLGRPWRADLDAF